LEYKTSSNHFVAHAQKRAFIQALLHAMLSFKALTMHATTADASPLFHTCAGKTLIQALLQAVL
jgi:hypothetical protein